MKRELKQGRPFGSRYFAEGISEAEQELVGPVIKKAGLMGIGPQEASGLFSLLSMSATWNFT